MHSRRHPQTSSRQRDDAFLWPGRARRLRELGERLERVAQGLDNDTGDFVLAFENVPWPDVIEAAGNDPRVSQALSGLTGSERRRLWPR